MIKNRILYLAAPAAVTKCHARGDSDRNLFSHNSGGWKSEIWVPAWLGSDEDCLPGLQMATFSVCSHVVERESDKVPGASFCKDINPIMGTVPAHMTSSTPRYLPEAHLQMPSH